MKKIVLLSFIATTILSLEYTDVMAQTCTAAPSCADMGYTKTIDDCSGKTTLKCPFDLTAVSCEESEQTTNSSIPTGILDWDSAIYTTDFATKTVQGVLQTLVYEVLITPDDGCYFVGGGGNVVVTPLGSVLYLGGDSVCLAKGDGASTGYSLFVPYKGNAEIKTADNCEIGDFYFSDNTCSKRSQTGKDIVGVVVDSDNRILTSYPYVNVSEGTKWSDSINLLVGATSTTNGKENTDKIISYKNQNAGVSFPAVEYCYNLSTAGKTWYLPSSEEIKKIGADNIVLQKISKQGVMLWTSTENSRIQAQAYLISRSGADLTASALPQTKNVLTYGGYIFSVVCFANY